MRTPHLYDLHDSEPNLAVIRMAEDDELWWTEVLRHATDNEYRYGLDEAPTQLTCYPETEYYDDEKVLAWLRLNVEPPKWRWHRWRLLPEWERDDERTHELESSADRANRLWWRGALVSLAPCGCTPTQECDRHYLDADRAFDRKQDV